MKQNNLELKTHLEEHIAKWQHILNSHYETDLETPLIDYAKGGMRAYIEILEFIKTQEKEDEQRKITEEASRVTKQAGQDGGRSWSKI